MPRSALLESAARVMMLARIGPMQGVQPSVVLAEARLECARKERDFQVTRVSQPQCDEHDREHDQTNPVLVEPRNVREKEEDGRQDEERDSGLQRVTAAR